MASRSVISWATLLVLVGVATTSPFKKEEPEPTVYYQVLDQHSGYGEHAGYGDHSGYEEHDYDHNAILAAKDETEDVIWLNTKIVEGLFVAGWIFWVYHIMRPEQLIDIEEITGRQMQRSPISKAMQLAMNSVDPIDMGMDFMEVQDPSCRSRIVCEVREMVKRVPAAEAMVDQYGWSLQSPTYSRAVLDGKAEADCGMRYRECSHSPVSMAYGVMRMLSAMY